MSEIVVVDYHKGNLASVARSVAAVGGNVVVSDEATRIASARGVIVPGVGSFEDAMAHLRASRQADAIVDAIGCGVPFLGICLGMQVLFTRGSERGDDRSWGGMWVPGLGVLSGSVTRLEGTRLKVPHVGWDQVHLNDQGRTCPLLADIPEGANVYFTHSYALDGSTTDAGVAVAATHYCRSFPSAVWQDNVFGVQFHPEKSGATGLRILRNFVDIVRG